MTLSSGSHPIDVSVVIISWRMRDLLRELLTSVKRLTDGIRYEIIVVDNDSRDGTAEMISGEFRDCVLIRNAENRGVAPARNQGFQVSRGKYVVTLDADMVLTENSLQRLMAFMECNPTVGLAGCKLISPNGKVQPSARRYPTPGVLLLRRLTGLRQVRNSNALRRHEMSEWDRKDTREVDYVIGACQFIRKASMEQVGLLDEKIFYGPEDIDYCLRMYAAGWKVFFVADTSIVHYEQRVTKKNVLSQLSFRHLLGILHLFRKYRGKLVRPARQEGGA